MKKYFFVFFVFVIWSIAALFYDLTELFFVAGFAVIECLLLFMPKCIPALLLAFVAATAVSILNVQFLFRCVPALLLTQTFSAAVSYTKRKTVKKRVRPDGVYTGVLLCFLISIGTLIWDVHESQIVSSRFSPHRVYWLFVGILFYLIFQFAVALKKNTFPNKKNAVHTGKADVFLFVYACGIVCVLTAAVGFALNSTKTSVFSAVFPWLLFVAVAVIGSYEIYPDLSYPFPDYIHRFLSDSE